MYIESNLDGYIKIKIRHKKSQDSVVHVFINRILESQLSKNVNIMQNLKYLMYTV